MTSENPNTPRQQDGETISPEDHAANEGGPGVTDSAVVLKVGPPPHHSSESQSGGYKTLQWWKDRLEVAAIAAGIFYAIVTFCMWRDAHDNFVINQRAWVGIDRPVNIEFLTQDGHHGGKTNFVITVKNFGNSVALSTAVTAQAISAWDKMKPASESSCANAVAISDLVQTDLMNGNKGEMALPEHLSAGVMFPSEEEGRHFSDVDIQTGNVPSPLMILGCIAYRDQFDKRRQTRFCYGGSGKLEEATAPELVYQCQLGPSDAK